MPNNVTYDRPVSASLHVHLSNGETFEASADDLRKFGYVDRTLAYYNFDKALRTTLGEAGLIGDADDPDLTRAFLNPVRYLAEVAIHYPELLHGLDETRAEIVELERFLAEHEDEVTDRLTAAREAAEAKE